MITERLSGHTLVDQAVELLNRESLLWDGVPLSAEAVETCFNEEVVFEFLGDLEERKGFDVLEARLLLERHYTGGEY